MTKTLQEISRDAFDAYVVARDAFEANPSKDTIDALNAAAAAFAAARDAAFAAARDTFHASGALEE